MEAQPGRCDSHWEVDTSGNHSDLIRLVLKVEVLELGNDHTSTLEVGGSCLHPFPSRSTLLRMILKQEALLTKTTLKWTRKHPLQVYHVVSACVPNQWVEVNRT